VVFCQRIQERGSSDSGVLPALEARYCLDLSKTTESERPLATCGSTGVPHTIFNIDSSAYTTNAEAINTRYPSAPESKSCYYQTQWSIACTIISGPWARQRVE
jgi:hypothetical protein